MAMDLQEEEFHSSGARLLQVDVPGSKSLHDTVSQAVQILEKEIAGLGPLFCCFKL